MCLGPRTILGQDFSLVKTLRRLNTLDPEYPIIIIKIVSQNLYNKYQ